MASTPAMASSCCCPPDSDEVSRMSYPSRPTHASAEETRRRTSSGARPRLRGPNATSSNTTVETSCSVGCWRTKPTRLRTSRRALAPSAGSMPSTLTAPLSHRRIAHRSEASVDFPEPLAPTSDTTRPGSKSKITSATAGGSSAR